MASPQPQSPPRAAFTVTFRLSTLLAVVTVVGLLLAGYVGNERWYSATYPQVYVYRVLHDSVKNGDSMESIQSKLGAGSDADPLHKAWFAKMAAAPALADGYAPDDMLLVYPLGDVTVFLQFRGGKLVNHDPQEFAAYRPATSIGLASPRPATP